MRLAYAPYNLIFKTPGGTSRGILKEKLTSFIKIWDEADPSHFGIGEAAVFPGLSPEAGPGYELKMIELLANVALGRPTDLSRYSSIQFGLEQAILDFSHGCKGIYYDSPFIHGDEILTINGLVWMGSLKEMTERIEEKVNAGFHCIKLKIGAIDWEQEQRMIAAVRERFSPEKLEIRVDANGGFNMENVFPRLAWLAGQHIHSIEQPIPAGEWELMAFVCKMSPVPVALDEELIGISDTSRKIELLNTVRPAYIILKPALCGGFSGASEWIRLAKERNIGWWVTSALESNVGLNAIAQWTATLDVKMPQGLGTGALFTNNFESPLRLDGEHLTYNPGIRISREQFSRLKWRE